MEVNKKYTNGEVTIIWKPGLCIHSTNCWKGHEGLKEVFDPSSRPWIKPEGASTERIIEQVKKCPSGALSYIMNNTSIPEENAKTENTAEVMANGPLIVHGDLTVKDANGKVEQKSGRTAFCRCGASANKPFCDGSHRAIGFTG
ncbi:MAG: (4Fe-4S)-binding protein [Saprospiraceae bacterium]|nr:(4Fe-4S)-binding protein [Saprospiraceae bacterium]